ncbi:MAG TPA: M67 family metallopeptidase [Crinalium sp.]
MALHLSPDQIQHIRHHAESTYPDECCGLLLGQIEPGESNAESNSVVVEARSLPNAWVDSIADELSALGNVPTTHGLTKSRRYWIDPKDMLEAQRYARDRHLTIVGIYHSHPDNPAVPSECDRVLAWPEYSYLIVSVPKGNAKDLLSWKLDDGHQFQSEPIRMCSQPSRAVKF